MNAWLLQRRFSRWAATCTVALLCACGMGPQSEQTLRTFARGVHASGRGYSGSLRGADAAALEDLGICRGDIDRVREGFGSGPMVIGGSPLLGVSRDEVDDAIDGDPGAAAGSTDPLIALVGRLGTTRPTVWHPCGMRAGALQSGERRATEVRPTLVGGQVRLGSSRIELSASRGQTAGIRLIGPNVTSCEWLTISTGATSIAIALTGTTGRSAVRTATVGMDAVDALDQATQLDVCGTPHVLDRTQRAALRKFVQRRRELIARGTAAYGTLLADLMSALEVAFHADGNLGPLTGVKSAVVAAASNSSSELWRVNGATGPVFFSVTLRVSPRGGTDFAIGPASPQQPVVLNAVGEALASEEYERAEWMLGLPEDHGDGANHLALGVMLLRGGSLARSPAHAAALFRRAAQQGNAKAEFNVALLYDRGVGVERNQEQALSWARRAADHGHAQALSFVGSFYALGEVVPQDWVQAESWYRKAAEQGDPEGSRRLGVMYSLGQGVTKNDATAFEWFRKSAEHGWPAGLVALGRALEDGLGTPRDDVAARDCYQRAQQAGHLEGTFRLGLLMLDGRGGVTDEAKGRELISQAAASGLEEARAFLATQPQP